MTATAESHRAFRACTGDCGDEVTWHRDGGETCWACGAPGAPCWQPAIGNQAGFGTAMPEREWSEVRRQIGA